MNTHFWITGIVPAVHTPMHPDGSLHLERIPAIVEHLIQDRVAALYVCGSTGEGPLLTSEERMAVAQAYVRASNGRIPVVVQVGHDSLREARRLARHAAEVGADAISATPPSFFKPGSLEVLLNCLAEIAAGAPQLPFYYYHIPRLTGVEIDVVRLLQSGREAIPSLNGLKYSAFTIFELQACAEVEQGRFNILFGSDEMLLSGLAGGAQGAVGSTYNFAAPLYNRIIDAFQRGAIVEAQRLQGLSVRMLRVLNRYGMPNNNLSAIKAVMGLIGLDCGPLRLPLVNLSAEHVEALRAELAEIGFFQWGRG
jgi:N-acetylneuraminate lyase